MLDPRYQRAVILTPPILSKRRVFSGTLVVFCLSLIFLTLLFMALQNSICLLRKPKIYPILLLV